MTIWVIFIMFATLVVLLLIFHAISLICDEHLVPTVEVFIKVRWNESEDNIDTCGTTTYVQRISF